MGMVTEQHPAWLAGQSGLSETVLAERIARLESTYQLWIDTDSVPQRDLDVYFEETDVSLYQELGRGEKSIVYRADGYAKRVPVKNPEFWVPRYVGNLLPVMGEVGFEQIVAFDDTSTFSEIVPAEIFAGTVRSSSVNRITEDQISTFADTVATSHRLNVAFDINDSHVRIPIMTPITVIDLESGYQPIADKFCALARVLGDCCMVAESGETRAELVDWMNPKYWDNPSPTPLVSDEFKGRIDAMELATRVVAERAARDSAWVDSLMAMRALTNVVRYKASSYRLAA